MLSFDWDRFVEFQGFEPSYSCLQGDFREKWTRCRKERREKERNRLLPRDGICKSCGKKQEGTRFWFVPKGARVYSEKIECLKCRLERVRRVRDGVEG